MSEKGIFSNVFPAGMSGKFNQRPNPPKLEDIKKFFENIGTYFWELIKGMGKAFKTFFCSLLSEKPKRNSNASTSKLPTNKYNTTNLQCTGGWIVWGTILILFFILALSYGWGAILGFFIFMAIVPLSKIFYKFFIGSGSKKLNNSKKPTNNNPKPNNNSNNNSNNDIITKKVKKMSSNLGSNGAKFYYFGLLIVLICIIGVSIKLGVLSKNW